ncbi:phosphonate ABC transporter ATP-binding protein [Desulfogranum mediterraneum]|uniref:phosphonate ABC transporter ATP-binding protein n=1 Tax=Desulfogranum mediterraneum TaxID=160661 RepID=UPI000A064EEC|nr:ATP-binding cassette domain-containing protein [Desulfogranum mediterraneum]
MKDRPCHHNHPHHGHRPSLRTPVLSLDQETIAYDGCIALNDISLQIGCGEKVALIGPSGAGKTTLLRRLYQLRPGECAFIHQQYALVPQLSVFHNIYMGRLDHHSTLHNLRTLIRPGLREREEITVIAESLGLAEKIWTRTGALSGGQQQRVAIGRALYRGGSILMADEPVSSLDMVQGREIIQLIVDIGQTVISSLHLVELSLEYFDRIIGLARQQLAFDLPAGQVSQADLDELYG